MNNLLHKFREDLHKIPETSFTETKTQAYLKDALQTMGYEPIEVAKTGLYVYIDGNNDETIAFRTDIDGLPVSEETNLAFQSTHPGYMHACGHDGHMTMVLTLADYLKDKKDQLKKNILLIFQPAEESIGGANTIVQTGIFDTYNVRAIFGIHLFPELQEGVIASRPGAFMAMANEINVTVHGKGAHGAMPHLGVDANMILAKLLIDFQMIQTRVLSPLEYTIITFGKIEGGSVRNQISDYAKMEGTIRSFSEETQQNIIQSIKHITKTYEASYDCTIDVFVQDGYPPVINDTALYQELKQAVDGSQFYEFPKPLMIAEDFSFYQRAVPGVFFFVGTRNEELGYVHSLHSPKFNYRTDVLEYGVNAYKKVLKHFNVI